jgi:hypothetical protein
MVVTIAIGALIMAAIVNSVLLFYKSNTFALEESFQIQSAQKGLDALTRDLREATYGDDGSYPLGLMGTSSITFYSDVDHSSPIERLHYELKNTVLTRTITLSTSTPPKYTGTISTTTVSDYVRNIGDNVPLFRYYDKNGAEVVNSANIADVVSVAINFVVDVTPNHAPGEFTLKSEATLRNLRPQ